MRAAELEGRNLTTSPGSPPGATKMPPLRGSRTRTGYSMRRILQNLLPFLAALAAFGAEPPDAGWVERLGGQVERAADGRIIAVDLSGTWATDADLRKLGALGSLERLDLSETRISDAGLEALAGLPAVVDLRLRFAEFVTSYGVAHLREWPALERLDLRGTKVTSSVFEHLARIRTLRSLDLSSTEVDDAGFEELVALPKLEELSCGANRLSGAALAALKMLPSLRRLDLGGIQRVDSGLWGLALSERNLERIAGLSQLESLSLRGATLSDRGVDRPGHELALRSEVRGLPQLGALTKLRRLDLGQLPLRTDDLAWLKHLTGLEELSLDGPPGIDDAIADTVLELERLEFLNLSGTSLSDHGLERLAEAQSLERLLVGDTDVSERAVDEFRSSRPECALAWWPKEAVETASAPPAK